MLAEFERETDRMKVARVPFEFGQHHIAELVFWQFHFAKSRLWFDDAGIGVIRRGESKREPEAQPVVMKLDSGEDFQQHNDFLVGSNIPNAEIGHAVAIDRIQA